MDQKTTNEIQDNYWNELEEYLTNLAQELGCSKVCAADVWYLRQRSRYTPELEDELIAKHAAGEPINICEFGHTKKKVQ